MTYKQLCILMVPMCAAMFFLGAYYGERAAWQDLSMQTREDRNKFLDHVYLEGKGLRFNKLKGPNP